MNKENMQQHVKPEKSIPIGIAFYPKILELVDEQRGDVSRSHYITKLVLNSVQIDNSDLKKSLMTPSKKASNKIDK